MYSHAFIWYGRGSHRFGRRISGIGNRRRVLFDDDGQGGFLVSGHFQLVAVLPVGHLRSAPLASIYAKAGPLDVLSIQSIPWIVRVIHFHPVIPAIIGNLFDFLEFDIRLEFACASVSFRKRLAIPKVLEERRNPWKAILSSIAEKIPE